MKKRFFYSLLLVFFVAAMAFILPGITRSHKDNSVYSQLLPRKASLVYAAEWNAMKNNFEVLTSKLKRKPFDVKSLLGLTAMYIQEGRNTGDLDYYNSAALKCINTVLEKDPKNFEAMSFKATILLSQHRFTEGLAIAEELQRLYSYNAYVYGLLVDGYVESGKYKEALAAADKMISIRPDIRSYSRIAYLREIHGDIQGAIVAMKLAVDAGAPGDENTEWCRVQLGKLFEKVGNIMEARMHYTIAVQNRQNYPYALAGLARLAGEQEDYDKALRFYKQADSLIPDHLFKEGIAEIYCISGQPEKAKKISTEILDHLRKYSGANNKTGQNEDHELAHAWMSVGNYDKALAYALHAFDRRPLNIEVNETVALAYSERGEYQKALPYIETALKTNCKDPELLCHAGLIYANAGNKEKAKILLMEGLKNNPAMPQTLKMESKEMLKSLNSGHVHSNETGKLAKR